MKRMILLIAISLSATSLHAASLASYKDAYIKKCASDGEHLRVCECSFKRWSKTIKDDEQDKAAAFIQLFIRGTQPTPQEIQQVQALMMRFQQTGMQCASETVATEPEPAFDIRSVTGNALSEDEADIINHSGKMDSAELMTQMKNLDSQNEAQRKQQNQVRKAREKQQQLERKKLQAELKKEIVVLESHSVIKQPVSAFKKAFTLSRQLQEKSKTTIQCEWQQLYKAAGKGPSASLTAYFSVIGGADFDQPKAHRPYMEEAGKKTRQYHKLREQCL